MSGLPLPSGSPHILLSLLPLGKAPRFGRLVRYRNRQQEIDWNAERARELLMQRNRAFALSGFEVRQVALGDANESHQFGLCHVAWAGIPGPTEQPRSVRRADWKP